MVMGCLLAVLLLCGVLAISWLITSALIYLITLCFGLTFSLRVATGVWLALTLLASFLTSMFNTK